MTPIQLILIGLVIWFIFKVWQSYQDPLWKNLPGPPHIYPYLGNYVDILMNDVSAPHVKWAEKYGSIFRYYVFGRLRVMLTNPADIKKLLINNHLFDKNLAQYHMMVRSFGKGLVTIMDEDMHKYHRTIISPAFAHKHLKALVPIFHKKGEILVEDWLKEAKTGSPTSIKQDIARATSDIIGESAFGYQLNSQRNDSPSSVYNIFNDVVSGSINMLTYLPYIQLLFPEYHTRTNAVKALDQQVKHIIDEKALKREGRKNNEESKEMRDLLDIMMDSESDEGAVLTREELADQTKTFLLAGYETSSVCILWTMHLLATHPDIQRKLREEVISVIGRDRNPTAEDIDKMPYMYKVVRESLRIRPPIPYVFRQATEDVTFGEYHMPKGTNFIVNIYHQHHDSNVWPNHDTFDPERWSTEESESNLLGSYIPFIMGARNCIGSKFATLEIRVLLAMIVQKLSFTTAPGMPKDVGRKGSIAMVPVVPIQLVFSTPN